MLDELTTSVRELVEGKEAVGFNVKFDLGASGIIFVAGTTAPMRVSNEDVPADTVFKVSAEDLSAMLEKTLAPMMAYMQGKLKVDGDLSQAMKLTSIFS